MDRKTANTPARIMLYTGKGGVGKTTVAAATALVCAERGYRTLAISTDAAHSLADSFDKPVGGSPTQIADNLWAQEPDMSSTIDQHWSTIQNWLATLFAWRGLTGIVADEMAFLPGMEELSNLLYIVDHAESGNYDVVVVDSAPTGETLRLLSFPEVLSWWMKRMFPMERQVARAVRPVLKPLLNVPIPDESVMNSIEQLFPQINKIHALLADPAITSMRLVVNPEKMVIKQTQRTFTYLNLYGYSTDLVICNRLIPNTVTDHYFDYWKTNQDQYFKEIEERFAPLPVLTLPLLQQEVVGLDMLRKTAAALYGSRDPKEIFYRGKANNFDKVNGQYVLSFDFPYTSKEDISVTRNADELIVQVGRYRRNIILPRAIVNLPVSSAKLENKTLVIKFVVTETGNKKKTRK